MNTDDSGLSNEAEPDLPTFQRPKRRPDTSKSPEIITTVTNVRALMKAKYGDATMDAADLGRLQNAAENFVHTLMQAVVHNHQQYGEESKKKGRSKQRGTPRVSSAEMWSGMASTASLRPVALRFLALGLVPEQYRDLFNYETHIPPMENISADISEDDDLVEDSNDGLNPLLFGSVEPGLTEENTSDSS
jgi:hypothetical protein